MSDARERAESLFARHFQADPAGVFSAPGRVNLIGEHTDYNDGFVLPLAISQRTVVAASIRDDGAVVALSEGHGDAVTYDIASLDSADLTGWAAYVVGVVWALAQHRREGSAPRGVSLAICSDVPTGAGLSSSAAVECAVAVAVNELWGLGLEPPALAGLGQKVENDVVGALTGGMDQMVSMLSLADHALFLDCRTDDIEHIPCSWSAAGLALVVMDTGVRHANASSAYGRRRESCEEAAAVLGVPALRDASLTQLQDHQGALGEENYGRARHIVTENARVLDTVDALRARDFETVGALFSQSHLSMRDDYEISCPELDLAVESAQGAGALGARMTGGGFGGCAIALISAELLSHLQGELHHHFSSRGWQVPRVGVVRASAGARVEQAL